MSVHLIGSFRGAAFIALIAVSAFRVSLFHHHAIYPVPSLLLVGRDLLLILPFVVVAAAARIVARTSFTAVSLLVITAAVVVSGAYLDYDHFAHLNKDSAFDGISYIGHTFASIIGAVLLLVFQPQRLDDERA
jgi:hypothetical protein